MKRMTAKSLRGLLLTQFGLLAFGHGSAIAEDLQSQPSQEARIVAAEVDRLLTEEVLHELPAGQSVAPTTGDQRFLRRAYLDLVGELPMPGEVTAFCLDASPEKRT